MDNEADLRAKLIQQTKSTDTTEASDAVIELLSYGWMYDGSLEGADFSGADLFEVLMPGANLPGVIFDKADLQGANLHKSNLSRSSFVETNLHYVFMGESNFKGQTFAMQTYKIVWLVVI